MDKYEISKTSKKQYVIVNKTEIKKLNELNEELKSEIILYKSIFNTHNNSAVFNLKIKKRKGKKVWVDKILDNKKYIESLDIDEEIIEWLKPVKCSK
tara:strand:- start:1367 stop:1657 length:291 start_codon:yes stop_codon:yes gene_type:complete